MKELTIMTAVMLVVCSARGDAQDKAGIGAVGAVSPAEKVAPVHLLPSGPEGSARFGAYYTTLEYDPVWDRPWRVGEYADVVVRFDDGGHRFVFWRGTSYIPHWVTENGIWYNNEFLERRSRSTGLKGCVEPMSDKQCRYSHVRIIENNDARVVVHWRYAPVNVEYLQPYIDEESGWGDWVDELYTIYPDGTGVRKATLHTTKPDDFSEWHEAIIVNQPGTMPEDNIEATAVSLANLKGETRSYTWTEEGGPKQFLDMPEKCAIQMVNLKSERKPFTIVDPEGLRMTVFKGHAPDSIFHHWDHWPVSQDKLSTRIAVSANRPSHSSLFNLRDWREYARTENSITRLMLHGLTKKEAGDLAPLARSWLNPPVLKASNGKYDPTERAYLLAGGRRDPAAALTFNISADEEHPLVNPTFVVKNWGEAEAALEINGDGIPRGTAFRYGHRFSQDGTDLIVWVQVDATVDTAFRIKPVQ